MRVCVCLFMLPLGDLPWTLTLLGPKVFWRTKGQSSAYGFLVGFRAIACAEVRLRVGSTRTWRLGSTEWKEVHAMSLLCKHVCVCLCVCACLCICLSLKEACRALQRSRHIVYQDAKKGRVNHHDCMFVLGLYTHNYMMFLDLQLCESMRVWIENDQGWKMCYHWVLFCFFKP